MKYVLSLGIAILFGSAALAAPPSDNDSHNVVVTVAGLNTAWLEMSGADIALDLTAYDSGSEQLTGSVSGGNLYWATNGSGRLITVQATSGDPSGDSITLEVECEGTYVPVTLTGAPLKTGISKSAGGCALGYRGFAGLDVDPAGTYAYTVTYTISN